MAMGRVFTAKRILSDPGRTTAGRTVPFLYVRNLRISEFFFSLKHVPRKGAAIKWIHVRDGCCI